MDAPIALATFQRIMNLKDDIEQIKDVLSPEEFAVFEEEFFLSESYPKEQILHQAYNWYMTARFKTQLLEDATEQIRTLKSEPAELRAANTPPVDDPDVCQCCGKVLVQATGGRKKKYCSEACKQKAKRERTH